MSASAHDFDFLFGAWHVHNRKLVDVTDPACTQWVEFGAHSEIEPILGGSGGMSTGCGGRSGRRRCVFEATDTLGGRSVRS